MQNREGEREGRRQTGAGPSLSRVKCGCGEDASASQPWHAYQKVWRAATTHGNEGRLLS